VADVYDALAADRVYREAWPAERALALLDDESGLAFDPECVAALRWLVAPKQPELTPAPARREHDQPPLRNRSESLFGEAAA
jgi:HD-GYP domain-containing protein (c-di-GMP phosphodiesterase class II)